MADSILFAPLVALGLFLLLVQGAEAHAPLPADAGAQPGLAALSPGGQPHPLRAGG
jgi:hypothetical protein